MISTFLAMSRTSSGCHGVKGRELDAEGSDVL